MSTTYIRHGFGSARPYLCGDLDLPEFVSYAFGAIEIERHQMGERSFHVEFRLGDSALVIEAGQLPADIAPWINAVYVYVEDVDAAYTRAIERGATSLVQPENKPYQERAAGVKDRSGNTWWIATYVG